uniref:Uncharacterized protein n=1 Tax=Kalanchoe fedtschenkoi TaxID=63787 RepID=A0A7N0T7M6_KALFE
MNKNMVKYRAIHSRNESAASFCQHDHASSASEAWSLQMDSRRFTTPNNLGEAVHLRMKMMELEKTSVSSSSAHGRASSQENFKKY